MAVDRLPFALAIQSDKLLKSRFDRLSVPQRVVLKAFYGLDLDPRELIIWSIFQGGATYDAMGYVTSLEMKPYVPMEFDTLVLYVGRRSGKTDAIIATAVAYEITLGGHRKDGKVAPDQELLVPFIAQTQPDAQKNMNFIKMALMESPLLSKELLPEDDQVATAIRLVDKLIVQAQPASKGVGRGHAIPVWVGDEIAFWKNDTNAANPDFEVVRAISYAQLQFPNAKTFLGTTPWVEQGVAFEAFEAGTNGVKLKCDECKASKALSCPHYVEEREQFEGTLVIHASTAAMDNPAITDKRLKQIKRKDPEAFPRESIAITLKSVSGWLNLENIAKSIDLGVHSREKFPRPNHPFDPTHEYIAAIDPAFRNDAFAFTILHHDPVLGIVQDYIEYWEPEPGTKLVPGTILDAIKVTLAEYGLTHVYSDQNQLESLQQLAQDRGFTINGFDVTSSSKPRITGGFNVLLNQSRIRLLDHVEQRTQLELLQKRVGSTGHVHIAAPPGKHDDLAMVLMLAAHISVWLLSTSAAPVEKVLQVDGGDHHAIVMAQIERKRAEAQRQDD